jgi:hypothetical protein
MDIVGKQVTLYGSWQEGLVFRRKDEDPNVGTDLIGPAFTAQTKGLRTTVYLQVAGSRIEGAPTEPFRPFSTHAERGGENDELLIFPMQEGISLQQQIGEQPDVSDGFVDKVEHANELPVMRAVTILNLFLEENPDVFIRTQDGKTHKAVELVRQEFVKL